MEALFYIMLFVIGACLGSFLCCQARRLHHRSRKGSKPLGFRSVCLHCRHQLRWYDNIPIFSWLVLKGKCRYCHKRIGLAELTSELAGGFAAIAVGSPVLTALVGHPHVQIIPLIPPFIWAFLILLILFMLVILFLAIYDGLYGELPVKYLTFSIVLAVGMLLLRQISIVNSVGFTLDLIWQPLGAILVLGGLYLALYLVSRGKWVGDGDWLLALALALALGDFWLALITLFLSNLFACLYALPRRSRHLQIHFGPFLVLAFVVAFSFADALHTVLGY